MTYKILLMGPQGSGKGTQAQRLSETLNIPAFGTGQLIRDEVASGTDLGQKLTSIINAGELVSDVDAAELLKKRLAQPDTENGYILDGYPRNIEQERVFDFDTPTHVIVIEVPRDESLKRLGGRLTDNETGKVYSVADGYKVGDIIPGGGELYQRKDDVPEAIERRLEIYEKDTQPVLDIYASRGVLIRIDGVGSVEEVFERILAAVKSE